MELRPFTIRDAINGVRRRKFLVIAIFASILGIVGFVTVTSEKLYESEAKLFIKLGRENVGLDPTLTLGEKQIVTLPNSREAEINSIAFMIRSRNLFENVVEEIGVDRILDGEPKMQEESSKKSSLLGPMKQSLRDMGVLNDVPKQELAVIKLQKHISVKTLERSNVLKVSFEAESPQLAKDVVDCLIKNYLEWHAKMHRTSGTSALLKSELAGIEKEIATREKAMEDFKTETGMISVSLDSEQLVQRIGTIKNNLLNAETLATALEKEVSGMQASLEKLSPTQIVSKTVGTGNDGVDGMRQDLYLKEIELEALLAKNTPQHPRVIELQDTIAKAKAILEKDEQQRTESVMGANPVYDELLVAILTKRPQMESEKAKVVFLKEELTSVESTLGKFNENERLYRVLERNLGITDEKYRRYVRSVAQAGLDGSLEAKQLSNISVSQPATFAEKPSRPNKLVNLILGIGLGLFGSIGLAVFLEYLSTTVRNRDDIESSLALPVIGTVPRVTRREAVHVEA